MNFLFLYNKFILILLTLLNIFCCVEPTFGSVAAAREISFQIFGTMFQPDFQMLYQVFTHGYSYCNSKSWLNPAENI